MAFRDAANEWVGTASLAATPAATPVLATPSSTFAALLWAGAASTLHRLRRGEGALPAVNLSLLAYQGLDRPGALAGAILSVLAIGLMYAFNDLHDAPTDSSNPKKDLTVVQTYLDHRRVGGIAILVLSLLTIGLAFVLLDLRATAALAGVMLVNVVYSKALKGVPVVDVIWCGLWGALYVAIVDSSPRVMLLVGLMTAVCHLYQALDDRTCDAANSITTTAVRSRALSRNVLLGLSVLLFIALRPALGAVWALTAFTPVAIFFACDDSHVGWLLTKVYFGVMWLSVLAIAGTAG